MLIKKLNLQLTILLRNNLTRRSRSICVPNALHLRSERAPFAFRTRSICVPNAFHLHFERVPKCVPKRSSVYQVKMFQRHTSLTKKPTCESRVKLEQHFTCDPHVVKTHVIHMWNTCDFTMGDFLTTTCG